MDALAPAEKLKYSIDITSVIATKYEAIGDNYILNLGKMKSTCHLIEFQYYLDKEFFRKLIMVLKHTKFHH